MTSDPSASTVLKQGAILTLPSDPDPSCNEYFLMPPLGGILVLLPKGTQSAIPAGPPDCDSADPDIGGPRDRNAILRRAFADLQPLVGQSLWTQATNPVDDLLKDCQSVAAQPVVFQQVQDYLSQWPIVRHSAEMLFTAISMSARAQWRAAPSQFRGLAARGWFLGRWVPTFLLVDGPISRFLQSGALKGQAGRADCLRAARRFLAEPVFVSLRHAFAHWAFHWESAADGSYVVAYDHRDGKVKARMHQREADAFHIAAFAIIEALEASFFRPSPNGANKDGA